MILRLVHALSIIVGCVLGEAASHERELRTRLMDGYNPEALPAPSTTVRIRFTTLHFDMNEQVQSLDLDMWMAMEWIDPRLQWNELTYPGISRLAFQRRSLWHPDLSLYNSAVTGKQEFSTPYQILVLSNGMVVWIPPVHVKATCVMDMLYWPYDTHNCTAKFGSWVHSAQTVDLQIKDKVVQFEEMGMTSEGRNLTRGEWSVLSSQVVREERKYECCPETYVTVRTIFVVQRSAPAYAWLVQAPVVVLCLLTVVVFILPPSSGEKVIIGGILLILDFAFLYGVSRIIGHSANHTPLIVKLVSKQLILTAVSVFLSAFILRLIRDPHSTGLPSCLRLPLVVLSTCMCLGGYRQMMTTSMVPLGPAMKNTGEDLELNEGTGNGILFIPEGKGGGGEGDWVLLAAVGDRLCLLSFTLVILAHIISYSSVL